jgi:hypothetical protein
MTIAESVTAISNALRPAPWFNAAGLGSDKIVIYVKKRSDIVKARLALNIVDTFEGHRVEIRANGTMRLCS